jgi:hypothetical protein
MKTTSSRRVLLLSLAVTMAAACHTVPLTAPVSSRISVSALSLTVSPGGSTEIQAVVVEEAGTFVQDGTEVLFTTTLGSVQESALTSGGIAHATFTAGSATGTARVTASSGDATGDPGTIDIVIGATTP